LIRAGTPDLNPIEQAISKIKAHLQKTAARPFDGHCENIGRIIDSFTPTECRNFLRNSGTCLDPPQNRCNTPKIHEVNRAGFAGGWLVLFMRP